MGTMERRGVSWFGGARACIRAARTLCVLAVLVVLVPFCFASSALAAETGQIAGKVTDASTQAAITGIEVCARGTHEYVTCEPVNGYGEYALQAVPSGTYTVEFRSQYPSVNYVFQEVTGVVVAAGESREVDAAMQLGGWTAGKVTAASTQAAIAGIMVCVEPSGGGYLNEGYLGDKPCVQTGSGGEYTVSRLPAGGYTVEFYAPVLGGLDFAPQFYNDKSHRSEAEEVAVRAGETTGEINAAMQPGGKITGVVINASTDAPIAGLQVCAIESQEPDLVHFRCATTNSSGEYTVPGLVTGGYIVEFHSPEYEGPLADGVFDYAPQFYDNQASYAQATKVPVTTGGTSSGIDATMQPGGNITGSVTAAATGVPLKGIEVCVLPIDEEHKQRCARTNTNGEYTLPQLRAGEYAVEFGGPLGENRGYVREYYSGKTLFSEADPVTVVSGVTISGMNASLHAVGEESVKPPPVVETAITSGLPISALLLKTTPLVTLMGSKLVILNNAASVHVVCSKAACQGSIELVTQTANKRHKGRAATASKEPLVLATGSFSLAEGRDGSVLLRLTPTGRKRLAHARRHPIAAKLVLSVQGGKTTTKTVLVG